MSAPTAPKVSVVRDVAGRNIIFLEASFGRDKVVTQYGPSYQEYVLRGGPVTIHYDVQLDMFRLSPMSLKDSLHDPRYQHIIDLPEFPNHSDEDSGEESDTGIQDDMDVDGGDSSDAIPPPSSVKIPRPPNSWILYRKDKSKQLNIATEASRQWKVERQGIKDYYQTLADEAARLHKMKYPNYRYKPGRK